MIFFENRFPLFGIVLEAVDGDTRTVPNQRE